MGLLNGGLRWWRGILLCEGRGIFLDGRVGYLPVSIVSDRAQFLQGQAKAAANARTGTGTGTRTRTRTGTGCYRLWLLSTGTNKLGGRATYLRLLSGGLRWWKGILLCKGCYVYLVGRVYFLPVPSGVKSIASFENKQ